MPHCRFKLRGTIRQNTCSVLPRQEIDTVWISARLTSQVGVFGPAMESGKIVMFNYVKEKKLTYYGPVTLQITYRASSLLFVHAYTSVLTYPIVLAVLNISKRALFFLHFNMSFYFFGFRFISIYIHARFNS